MFLIKISNSIKIIINYKGHMSMEEHTSLVLWDVIIWAKCVKIMQYYFEGIVYYATCALTYYADLNIIQHVSQQDLNSQTK